MAEVNTDEEERKAAANPQSRGVALADETPDELPALLAIAVGIAILAITIVWPSIRDRNTDSPAPPTEEAAAEVVEEEPEPEEDPEPVEEAAGPDIPTIQAGLPAAAGALFLAADGNTVVVEGVVPDEATREATIAFVEGQPNVDAVDATALTVEAPAPAAEAAVDVTAQQVSIVLEGTVPDEATKTALVERAVSVYSEEQVEDLLEVDPAVQPPVTVTIGGSMTDPVLFDQVITAFVGMDGVTVSDANTIVLAESTEVEAFLNNLEPIEFASGSSLIQPASEAILDEAAEFLIANPGVSLEIGGHTDSTGDAGPNESLSQDRAESVKAALESRGVTNTLSPVGFGERRLKVPDEGDTEAQQMNRRIEFREIN